jgi:type IV pilus assembly protein PilM
MRFFVQSWFSSPSSPIGVDFGSDCLRLAQVEPADGEYRLVAAASADVPPHVRNEPNSRFNFFVETVRELLSQGNFRGRRVALNMPASMMHIQHLRLPKMDEEGLKKALPWEIRGKVPFDPTQAVIRHIIAGEIFHDQEPKFEVIVMAARKDLVEQLIASAARARLDVAGINVEPKAVLDCFSRIYRRKADFETATLFADIGCTATRAIITQGGRIRFARVIPIGGEHFSRAVASALQIPLEQARVMRAKIAQEEEGQPQPAAASIAVPETASNAAAAAPRDDNSFALLSAAVAAAEKTHAAPPAPATAPAPLIPATPQSQGDAQLPAVGDSHRIEQAYHEPISRLVEELSLCRRYYETTFSNQPLQRMVFIGGEANQRGLCQQIARTLGIAAQVGDPMTRINKDSEVGIDSGIDRRRPQPAWAIAVGLSMGPMAEVPAN